MRLAVGRAEQEWRRISKLIKKKIMLERRHVRTNSRWEYDGAPYEVAEWFEVGLVTL